MPHGNERILAVPFWKDELYYTMRLMYIFLPNYLHEESLRNTTSAAWLVILMNSDNISSVTTTLSHREMTLSMEMSFV